MGIGTSIDYDAIIAFQRFVNFIDQSTFVVALENVTLHPKAVHTVPDLFVDGFQRILTVSSRFTDSGQVNIWSMQYQYLLHNAFPPNPVLSACNISASWSGHPLPVFLPTHR